FDMQIGHDDTLTPLQREFIRLAQIFKGRLITELEYKQRVRERAIIEERIGKYKDELADQYRKEEEAREALRLTHQQAAEQQKKLFTAITKVQAKESDFRRIR